MQKETWECGLKISNVSKLSVNEDDGGETH